jgi:hypothetical protein
MWFLAHQNVIHCRCVISVPDRKAVYSHFSFSKVLLEYPVDLGTLDVRKAGACGEGRLRRVDLTNCWPTRDRASFNVRLYVQTDERRDRQEDFHVRSMKAQAV